MRERAVIPFPEKRSYTRSSKLILLEILMSRPISWLPRIPQIRRSVSESVRSHYGRKDLERLFELQPRAAQKLLELLPSVSLGTSRFVERAALGEFLDRMAEAEDFPAALLQYQAERTTPKRVLRDLVPRDSYPANATSLPENVSAAPGVVTIHFLRMEDLAAALASLASVLTEDLEGFAQLYEPSQRVEDRSQEQADYQALKQEMEEMERVRKAAS